MPLVIPGLNAFVEGVNAGRNQRLNEITRALQLLDQGLARTQRLEEQNQAARFNNMLVEETQRTGSFDQALLNLGTQDIDPATQTRALTLLNARNDQLRPISDLELAQNNLTGPASQRLFDLGGGRQPANALEGFSFSRPTTFLGPTIARSNQAAALRAQSQNQLLDSSGSIGLPLANLTNTIDQRAANLRNITTSNQVGSAGPLGTGFGGTTANGFISSTPINPQNLSTQQVLNTQLFNDPFGF